MKKRERALEKRNFRGNSEIALREYLPAAGDFSSKAAIMSRERRAPHPFSTVSYFIKVHGDPALLMTR